MKFIVLLLLFMSCTKKGVLNTQDSVWNMQEIETEVVSVKNIPWEIGKKRDAEVSQGLFVTLKVPLLEEDDLALIQKKYGADSYLFEIKKVSGPTPRLLGHLRIPFKNINRFMHEINFKILYHSAAVSQRFRRFECPAFNHRRVPTDIEINTNGFHPEPLYFHYEGEFSGMITNVENFPASFSGDLELSGVFELKFAIYDSIQKKLYSKFMPVKGKIFIEQEKEVAVPSCSGVKQENDPNTDSPSIKLENFKLR